jgi:hypothetical protein
MALATAQAASLIDARPADVYAVLADYQRHHPHIMPPSLFSNLEVESGGVGAGTVFHITLRLAGKRQRLHMRVGEPEPGSMLTETNLDTGVVTEFSVASTNGETPTIARISQRWDPGGGLKAMIDRLATPLLLRWIFTKQLRQLGQYMQSIRASGPQ